MSLKQNILKIKWVIVLLAFLLTYNILLILNIDFDTKDEEILFERVFEIDFTQNNQNLDKNQNTNKPKSQILASKRGKNYYFSHCSGAKKIKTENIIYFMDELSAQKAGYVLAKNCK
ncbi:MAG TPA: hypothetical protein PJ997_00095 [Candidatus Paceibacterota bacterium]|nr:hypothetical protein [Candidatus Paceibacterota bacterium]HMP18731.1 hypothetical protein [Candidatus Paceibacterota bacterium]HMP85262.1 hypothetical protein [Candidatus Paceibacterota bacterium]